jgi:PAS domain S-box-containing protein
MNVLFIEITADQIYWLLGGFLAATVAIGGLAGAVKGIRGEIWNPFKKGFLMPRKERKLKMAAIVNNFDEVISSQKRIEAELSTNGGKSLKDTVNRIDRKTEHLQARARHQDNHSVRPIFELDASGGLTFANAALCETLGVDEEDLMFRNWVSRVVPEQRQSILREIADAVDNKMPLDAMIRFNGKGGIVTMHFTAQPYVRGGGELVGFFGTADGISVGE